MGAIKLVDVKLGTVSAIGASVTNQVISKDFGVHWAQSLNFRCDIVCSSVTASTGISAKLQHRTEGGSFANLASTNASVAITGNGTFSIVLNYARSGDQADMPLRKQCQIVITTGAGDAVTIDKIMIQQE